MFLRTKKATLSKTEQTMQAIKYFLIGIKEFRLTLATNAGVYRNAYDLGRELAHRLTFRYFDPSH